MRRKDQVGKTQKSPGGSRRLGFFRNIFLAKNLDIRQCPTLPHGLPCSTIGAEGLYCCVRYGNRCGPFAITTGILLCFPLVERFSLVQKKHIVIQETRS